MNKVFTFRKSNLLSFVLGMAGVLIMAFLNQVGFSPLKTVQSVFKTEISKSQNIPLQLQKIKNDFKVKRNTSFALQANADYAFNDAKAYGSIDFDTGEIYAQKNISSSLPIASVTKIMTAIVALDLANKDTLFTVSDNASRVEPTKIGVVPGQKMKLSELLNAMLLTSANDAAQVVREGVDKMYGDNVFVDAMNKKAQILGLSDTHFSNPQGFDSPQNYSSVEDLAVLAHYALNHYSSISEIVKKDYQFLPSDQNHKQFDLYNWNGLVDVYPNMIGLKIGNTDQAGYTTVVVSERNNKKIISIVLGAPGVIERDLWAAQLLDYGYEKSKGLSPVAITVSDLKNKYSTWKYWN